MILLMRVEQCILHSANKFLVIFIFIFALEWGKRALDCCSNILLSRCHTRGKDADVLRVQFAGSGLGKCVW